MFLLRLVRYLKGYILFSVKGTFLERFLNMAARRGIPLWDGHKQNGEYQAYTLAKRYREFRPLARKAGVRTKVLQRHGAPFLARKYRKRTGILAGAIAFLLVIGVLSQFVWRIEVVGNERVSSKEVVENLDRLGLHPGSLKSKLDTRVLEEKLMLSLEDLSWAAINLRGSTATIELKERVLPPKQIDTDIPHNVIASRTGQIKRMEVYNGQTVVQKGEAVKEGDILVSGLVTDNSGKSYYRHARAVVMAEVEETVTIEVPLQQTVTTPTNEVKNHRTLNFFGLQLPLDFHKVNGENSYHRERTTPVLLFGFELPLSITLTQAMPLEEVAVQLSEEKAREMAFAQMEQFELRLKSRGKIVDKSAKGELRDGKFVIEGQYLVLEDIAKEQPILMDQEKAL